MKRFFSIILFSLIAIVSYAQVQTYRATSYAIADVNVYTHRYTWSSWNSCNVPIKFDLSNDIIVIYSNTTQIYRILSTNRSYIDDSGGQQVSFSFIDQDGDYGTLRLRIETNGNSQLYVDFNNVAWVYNVYRTS